MKNKKYEIKEQRYFSHVRHEVIDAIKDKKELNVAEIGGGTGNTLIYLKKTGIASSIHLYDIVDFVKEKDEFDSIHIGDVESCEFPTNKYDIIILADVLEHLFDPKETIKRLIPSLKKEGLIICSIPNIRHFKAFYKIFIRGTFKYEDSGLFDFTHIRFFCKKDMIKLLDFPNILKRISIRSSNKFVKSKASILDKVTFKIFSDFLTVQYIIVLKNIKTEAQ